MPITSSSRPVSSAKDCYSTSPSHIPGSSGPPSDPGCAPSDPGSRPPNSSSQPRYASDFLNFSWIPRNTTSSRNSSPNERIPIKCRASNSQLERKFSANPRLSSYFDRLQIIKLQQAYELLVPNCVRLITSERSTLSRNQHEGSGNLCEGLLGQAEGGQDHREPDSS